MKTEFSRLHGLRRSDQGIRYQRCAEPLALMRHRYRETPQQNCRENGIPRQTLFPFGRQLIYRERCSGKGIEACDLSLIVHRDETGRHPASHVLRSALAQILIEFRRTAIEAATIVPIELFDSVLIHSLARIRLRCASNARSSAGEVFGGRSSISASSS